MRIVSRIEKRGSCIQSENIFWLSGGAVELLSRFLPLLAGESHAGVTMVDRNIGAAILARSVTAVDDGADQRRYHRSRQSELGRRTDNTPGHAFHVTEHT